MFNYEFDGHDSKYYVTLDNKRIDKLGGFTHPRYATAAIEQLEKELKDGKSRSDKPKAKSEVSKEAESKIKETTSN